MSSHDLRHVSTDAPRVMVVDGSKLVRKLIGDVFNLLLLWSVFFSAVTVRSSPYI